MDDSETPRMVSISTSACSLIALSPIHVTMTWNEEIMNFRLNDLVVDTGVPSQMVACCDWGLPNHCGSRHDYIRDKMRLPESDVNGFSALKSATRL